MAGIAKQSLARVDDTSAISLDPVVGVLAREAERRERLTGILAAGGVEVAGRAWDVEGLVLERVDEPTVVVHATDTPDRAAALRPVRDRFPNARIVVVVPTATQHAARKAIEAGVSGLVLEADAERTLCLAVESVAAGHLTVPVALADGLGKPVLSNRERQVLGMVVMGYTNADIARRLFLAESTVKSHLSSIFGKLGVRSRKEAAALVLDPDSGLGMGILAISDEGAAAGRRRAHEASA